MRTFTFIIIAFLLILIFFEVFDWTPQLPSYTQTTKERTVIVETIDETGEVINTTIHQETTQENKTNSD